MCECAREIIFPIHTVRKNWLQPLFITCHLYVRRVLLPFTFLPFLSKFLPAEQNVVILSVTGHLSSYKWERKMKRVGMRSRVANVFGLSTALN